MAAKLTGVRYTVNNPDNFTPEGPGSVAFEYALCDVDGDCSSATAQIEVPALEIFDDSFEAP